MVRTISDEYVEQNRRMHGDFKSYGAFSARWFDKIRFISESVGSPEILDYGCGKGGLVRALNEAGYRASGYDPAVEEFSSRPKPSDIVICTDVLEHVEPEYVQMVLDDLRDLTKHALYVIVSTVHAKKTLSDGRNAHLSVRTANEWVGDFIARFNLAQFHLARTGFSALLYK